MPINYILREAGSLIIVRYLGTISHSEFISHSKRMLKDRAISSPARGLADMRQANFPETDFEGVYELSDLYVEANSRVRFSRYAVLARAEEGVIRRVKLFSERLELYGVKITVFGHLAPASMWVGLDPFEAEELIARVAIDYGRIGRFSSQFQREESLLFAP